MEKPGYMSQVQWDILVSMGQAELVAKSTYKHPVMPPELRIHSIGWEAFLEKWEQQSLISAKKSFLKDGIEYASLRGLLNNYVGEDIRLHRYIVLRID